MNEYTLEAFIGFCDDMMIAEEGNIIESVKRIGQRLLQKINELIQRITVRVRSSNGKCYVPKDIYDCYTKMITHLTKYQKRFTKRDNDRDDSINEINQALKEISELMQPYRDEIDSLKKEMKEAEDNGIDGSWRQEYIDENNKELDKYRRKKTSIHKHDYVKEFERDIQTSKTVNMYENYDLKKNFVVIPSSVLISELKTESKFVMNAIKENDPDVIKYYRYRYETVLYLVQNLFKPFK